MDEVCSSFRLKEFIIINHVRVYNYFAIQSSSEEEVQKKLNDAKIKSIVDTDKADVFVKLPYQRNGVYNWVVVSTPANSGFANGRFFHNDQFDKIAHVFETMIQFFQEEYMNEWNIKMKLGDAIFEKKFVLNKKSDFSEHEKAIFSKCFNKEFTDLSPFLQVGKSEDFLNFVGIPYLEMNDQDKIPIEMFGNKYSLLSEG